MANPEHEAILREGIAEWNNWRCKNPDVRPDFSGSNFARQYLPSVDLHSADLSNAVLCGAYLAEANLWKADLTATNLGRLSGWRSVIDHQTGQGYGHVHFLEDGANFTGAVLAEATLAHAKAGGVLFKNTNLERTDFYETEIYECLFVDCDLTNTDFRRARFVGHSTVDQRTLRRSKSLPRAFLQGCGLPEAFIEYLPALLSRALEFYSCFISYSHADKAFAGKLHDALQSRGIRCWLDGKQLRPGDDIYQHVDRGIRLWDKVLLCCSKSSLTSWWVDNEIGTALEKERDLAKRGSRVQVIIPLNLDGHIFSEVWQSGYQAQIRRRLAVDFAGWDKEPGKFDREIEEVVRALRADEGARETPPRPRL
jgi:hypothetical protein